MDGQLSDPSVGRGIGNNDSKHHRDDIIDAVRISGGASGRQRVQRLKREAAQLAHDQMKNDMASLVVASPPLIGFVDSSP
jgi:RNase P protein component